MEKEEKEAEGSSRGKAWAGFSSLALLTPCLWWTEFPSHWRPGYDLAFLKILLELLNNQFKNKRAFLHLRLRFFFLQSSLVTNSYTSARECRNQRKGLWFHMAIALPVLWAEIGFSETPFSNFMMLFRSMSPSSLLQKSINNNQVACSGA